MSTPYSPVYTDAMAPVPHHSSDDVLFAEASGWFARLHADDVTAEDRREFLRWCAQSADHARAWDEVQGLFGDLHRPATAVHDRLKQHGEYPFTPDRMANIALPMSRRHRGKTPVRWAAVAVMIICIAVATLWAPSLLQNLASDYHTGKGEQQRVALVDGSQVLLNTDTAIAVDLSGHLRRIAVLRGEAYFEMQATTDRPAVVISQQGEMRVTGTAFNVAQRGERTIVTVTKGLVEISHAAHRATPVPVHAGYQVSYDLRGVGTAQSADLAAVTAWQRGQIVFWQRPLTEVIAEVNRYHPGRLVIINRYIRQRPVTGAFETQRLDGVLEALQHSLGVNATRLTGYLILLH